MSLTFRILLFVVVLLICACQRGLYLTEYRVTNSTPKSIYVEWQDELGVLHTSYVRPEDTWAIHSVEYGTGVQDKIHRPPSSEMYSFVVRSEDEFGVIIYMGVLDDDWVYSELESYPNYDFWDLDITED